MKLFYGVNSPYSRKVRVVLAEHGVTYEPAEIVLAQPTEEFLGINPNMRLPCLVDGERVLWESNLILEYLLQAYPARGGAPADPPLAASLTRPGHHWEDLLVLNTIETTLDSGLNLFQFLRHGMTIEQSPFLQREAERIQSNLDWLESHVSPEGYVPGVFSIQDLNLVITLEWLDFRKPVPWRGGNRSGLKALVTRYAERPSLQTTRPGA